MALDATWGGESANSYITSVDADTMITENISDSGSWSVATNKSVLLIEASRHIDTMSFRGCRWLYRQSMEFPRSLEGYESFPWNNTSLETVLGNPDQVEMLQDVQLATCYQALWILKASNNHLLELKSLGVTEVDEWTGPVRDSYKFGNVSQSAGSSKVCPDSLLVLRKWRSSARIWRG